VADDGELNDVSPLRPEDGPDSLGFMDYPMPTYSDKSPLATRESRAALLARIAARPAGDDGSPTAP
jgi:hypothetical protein